MASQVQKGHEKKHSEQYQKQQLFHSGQSFRPAPSAASVRSRDQRQGLQGFELEDVESKGQL